MAIVRWQRILLYDFAAAAALLVAPLSVSARDVEVPQTNTQISLQLLAATLPPPASAPKLCEAGHIMADRPIGGYHFMFGSWYRNEKNVYVYTTCVENRGTNTVYIDWVIPGPRRNYIAAGDSAYGLRYFPDHKTVGVLSCLIYGNFRVPIREQYLGHAEDVQRANDEGDCSKIRGEQTSALPFQPEPLAEPPWFVADGRVTFPTNVKIPEASLVSVDYHTGLQPTDGGKDYTVVFSYEAGAVSPKDFQGEIGDISVRATTEIMRKAIMQTGRDDGVIHLKGYKGSFPVSLSLPAKYTIANTTYEFSDRNG